MPLLFLGNPIGFVPASSGGVYIKEKNSLSPIFPRERVLVITARSTRLALAALPADAGHGPEVGSSASTHSASQSPPPV